MENIYIKLNEKDLEMANQISELTGVDYELKEDIISIDSLISMIKELKLEIIRRDETIENIKQNIEDNYRPITNREMYGDYEDYRLKHGIID